MDRRNPPSRPDSIDETSRVPVIDYAGTGVYRQTRQARTPTPVRTPAPRAGMTDTRPVLTRAPAPVRSTPEALPEARPAARVEARPATGSGALAHPRLVPRPRTTPPPEPLPRLMLRPACRDRDFEEEPTDEVTAARGHDVTRPRDVTAARSRRYR